MGDADDSEDSPVSDEFERLDTEELLSGDDEASTLGEGSAATGDGSTSGLASPTSGSCSGGGTVLGRNVTGSSLGEVGSDGTDLTAMTEDVDRLCECSDGGITLSIEGDMEFDLLFSREC